MHLVASCSARSSSCFGRTETTDVTNTVSCLEAVNALVMICERFSPVWIPSFFFKPIVELYMFCVQLFPVNLYNKLLPCLHGDWSCIMCVYMSVQVIANSEEEHACTHAHTHACTPTHTHRQKQVSTAHKFVDYVHFICQVTMSQHKECVMVPSTLAHKFMLSTL